MSQNRYEVLGQIAEGGLGAVYKAYDRNLRREVALKRVRAETPEQAEQQAEQLMEEARNLSTLQHPHVVTIYDVGRDEEGAYIIMELLKGETLENIIERGALAESDFRELVSQSLEGLVAAHSNGLIHLDIKPQNFMVIWLPSGKFQIKILDFGLAKIAHQPTVQEMDEEGAIMGSIFFMAPEQFERSPVDARTDLYSLGCVYYYALTQHYPFQGETGPEVMASHLYHSLIPLSQLRPDLPPFIHQWVEWLMNRLPDHRPADAAQAYAIFQAGGFPQPETGEVQLGPQEGYYEQPGTGTGPLRPTAPRPTRPGVPRPGGGQSQPLSNRPVPRPIARPVNIAAAMAPRHLSHKKPLPKAAVFGIPVVIVAIIAAIIGWQQFQQSRHNARLQELAHMQSPKGTVEDVPVLLNFLEDKGASDAAAKVLGHLDGVESGNGLIVGRLSTVKNPWAKKNLAGVIALRGIKDTSDALLNLLSRTTEPDVRIAIWSTLAKVGTSSDTSAFLDKMKAASIDELKAVEVALVNVAQTESDPSRRGSEVLNAFGSNSASDDEQAMLLRALCRIGNKAALPAILKSLKSDNTKLRYAGALALESWPTAEPVAGLVELLRTEKDEFTRLNAINTIGTLASLSGDTPQAEIAQSLIGAYGKTKDARAQNEILKSLAKVTDPAAASFFDDISKKEPRRKPQCDAAMKSINTTLLNAVTLGDGATTLPADKAILTPGPLVVNGGVIVSWIGAADQVSWLVKIEKPGAFDIQISQASAAQQQGRYALTFGNASFTRNVDATANNTAFKSVSTGSATIAKPGLYRLWIRPVELPAKSELMRLKEAVLTRSGQ